MLEAKLNINLLWERIYHYVDYSNLSDSDKKVIDKIFERLYQGIVDTHYKNEYRSKHSDVFDYDSTKIEDLRSNFGNWLIDNKLNLVFSNLFGGHIFVLADLMALHCFKEKLIKKHDFFNAFETARIADLYTGLHYGVYLSGGSTENVEEADIVIGSRYFLQNKDINQDRLTRHFELNVLPFSKTEAEKELQEYLNS